MNRFAILLFVLVGMAVPMTVGPAQAQDGAVYPAAIFPFNERGNGVRDFGPKISDLLFASLVINPELILVDRTDMKKILGELELNLSGAVKADEANKIGQMTGAKILISGTVIQVDKSIYLVARIVGTETSRILGASIKGKIDDELAPMVEKLAEKVAETITKQSDKLVAKQVPKKDRIAELKKKIKGDDLPSVFVKIKERHIGMATIDPAAQTEVEKFAAEVGFPVIDAKAGNKGQAAIYIAGEGFSEFASRRDNLVAVKARVEIKAIDRKTGKVIASDRQTALAVDLTEQIAGKTALQQAAAILAERILPKLTSDKK